MYFLLLIVTRGRSSMFLAVDICEVWSEEVLLNYSAADCARSKARNRAMEGVNRSSEVRELVISIKSDGMRNWLRIKADC